MRRVRRRAVIRATRKNDFLYKDYKLKEWQEDLDNKRVNICPSLMLLVNNVTKKVQKEIYKCIRESYNTYKTL